MLDARQRHAFEYFLCETNSANDLVVDKTKPDALASIAAHGLHQLLGEGESESGATVAARG